MRPAVETFKGAEKILGALSEFGYLTVSQLTRLLYAPSSQSYVQKQLTSLTAAGYVMPLAHRFVTQPRVYALTGKGQSVLKSLGVPQQIRVRPREEKEKAHNFLFLQHTIAVTDVLIAARLLSQTVPDIALTRMYTERELKRKIYVEIPDKVCIEPDASCEFEVTVTANGTQHTGVDFFHIEVYRTLPPAEWRFKQKIKGYVTYALSSQHEELFQTPALSIAVIAQTDIAQTDRQKVTLKRWTEEALQEMKRPEEGEWFFFCSLDAATASPEDLFLSPVWEQAFGTAKTPLLILAEETK
jgi:DNA-binding HxlR family transcriptional regulator